MSPPTQHAPERVTVAELARRRGVTPAAVRKAERTGRIPPRGGDGLFDAHAALAAWESGTRVTAGREHGHAASAAAAPGAHGAGAPATVESLVDARTRRERAQADLAELRVAQERAQLARVDVVERVVYERERAVRQHVTAITGRIAHELAATSDVAAVRRILDDAIAEALEGFLATLPLHARPREDAGAPESDEELRA